MKKINDVSEAWGVYVLAREYLLEHAPHLLIETLPSKAADPVVSVMYTELSELIKLKGKIEWVINQEEERELDLHITEEDSTVMTTAEHLAHLDEQIAESITPRINSVVTQYSWLRNNHAEVVQELNSLKERVRILEGGSGASKVFTAGDKDWKPTEAELKELIEQFKKAEQDPNGGFVNVVREGVAVTEDTIRDLAGQVRDFAEKLPKSSEIRKALATELEEVVEMAAQAKIDLREQLGGLLSTAAEAVTPKKPRAPRKPRTPKPTE